MTVLNLRRVTTSALRPICSIAAAAALVIAPAAHATPMQVRVEAHMAHNFVVKTGERGFVLLEGDGTGNVQYRVVDESSGQEVGSGTGSGDAVKIDLAPGGTFRIYAMNYSNYYSDVRITVG